IAKSARRAIAEGTQGSIEKRPVSELVWFGRGLSFRDVGGRETVGRFLDVFRWRIGPLGVVALGPGRRHRRAGDDDGAGRLHKRAENTLQEMPTIDVTHGGPLRVRATVGEESRRERTPYY